MGLLELVVHTIIMFSSFSIAADSIPIPEPIEIVELAPMAEITT